MPKTKFDPQRHHRRSIRLPGYDYTRPGAYFLTLVVRGRENLFGEIINEKMYLNAYGRIVNDTWKWLGDQYAYVESGDWIVMPNHFHGILIIHEFPVGVDRDPPLRRVSIANRWAGWWVHSRQYPPNR